MPESLQTKVLPSILDARLQVHLLSGVGGVKAWVVADLAQVVLVPWVHPRAVDPAHPPHQRHALVDELEDAVARLEVAKRVVPLWPHVDVVRGGLQVHRLAAPANPEQTRQQGHPQRVVPAREEGRVHIGVPCAVVIMA